MLKRSSVTSVTIILYECLAENVASLNLRNVVQDTYEMLTEVHIGVI